MSGAKPSAGGPRLQVTSGRTMALSFGAGALLGWLIISGMEIVGVTVPVPPWTLISLLGLLGLVGVVWSRALRRRVKAEPSEVSSEEGVLALTLGKTMVIIGLLFAGGHLVLALTYLNRLDAPLPRERVIGGALTMAAGLLTAVGGWLLERACIVESDNQEPPSSAEDLSIE